MTNFSNFLPHFRDKLITQRFTPCLWWNTRKIVDMQRSRREGMPRTRWLGQRPISGIVAAMGSIGPFIRICPLPTLILFFLLFIVYSLFLFLSLFLLIRVIACVSLCLSCSDVCTRSCGWGRWAEEADSILPAGIHSPPTFIHLCFFVFLFF